MAAIESELEAIDLGWGQGRREWALEEWTRLDRPFSGRPVPHRFETRISVLVARARGEAALGRLDAALASVERLSALGWVSWSTVS